MKGRSEVDSSSSRGGAPPSAESVPASPKDKTAPRGRLNQCIARCGRALVTAAEEGDIGGIVWRFFRRVTIWLTVANVTGSALLWAATRWIGEQNITTAFLIFVPPVIWFLPALPILALSLVFHRRCFLVQLGAVLLMLWGWLGYGWTRGTGEQLGDRTDQELSIMTYNRGQHMNQSLQPFKNATRPDILVFQDAANRAQGFLSSPDYAEFVHGRNVGEFTLLSRFPIMEAAMLPATKPERSPCAARFVIDWNGRAISVYAVHMWTPRDVLSFYVRGAFLWGVLGVPGTPGAAKREHYQTFWDGQIADAEAILAAIGDDPNPCLAGGDFNSPSTGYIHRMITKELGDAHLEAGRGLGFTFPGVTRNPLSLGGPWMRIDYIFHDRRWEALNSIAEKNRPSQHRATMATLRLSDAP